MKTNRPGPLHERTFVFNEVMKKRRQTLIELAKMIDKGKLKEELPKLPKRIIPDSEEQVYLEREILSQKIKIYLGLDYDKTRDIELYEIARDIEQYMAPYSAYRSNGEFIQVIKEACDKCPSGRYYVTDLCRNCLAHSCYSVCPRKAIEIRNNRAYIDSEKCVGCGLCAKACQYYSIVKLERPCETACPVDAISRDDTFAADIDKKGCVSCGTCSTACPFGAIEATSDFYSLIKAINEPSKTIAVIAPSIVSQFGPQTTVGQIKNAILKCGFDECLEVAIAADYVAKKEAQLVTEESHCVLTSCCPAFVDYVKKYQKGYEKNISPVPSPMAVIGNDLRIIEDKTKIIFIGPCFAKKKEAWENKAVDFVMTYEELGALFIAKGVEPTKLEPLEIGGSQNGWGFAYSGGVTEALGSRIDIEGTVLKMNGLVEADRIFKTAKGEAIQLIEGMACRGGCIAGPGITIDPAIAKKKIMKIKQ